MKPSIYKVSQEKWNGFLPNIQLQHIVAELLRATHASLRDEKESERIKGAYERALSLIDASLSDSQWKDKTLLYQLRDAVAALYTGETDPAITRFICSQLLENSKI